MLEAAEIALGQDQVQVLVVQGGVLGQWLALGTEDRELHLRLGVGLAVRGVEDEAIAVLGHLESARSVLHWFFLLFLVLHGCRLVRDDLVDSVAQRRGGAEHGNQCRHEQAELERDTHVATL